jgi:predicted AlkP superfamily pyrophosphatase or phosphodiesterase
LSIQGDPIASRLNSIMNIRIPLMLKPLSLALALAAAWSAPSAAQPRQPRLIVAISVDQLSTDLFNQYRPQFTGGLRRLAQGIVFANGYQAHGATETCPGHSTILTGAHPARTGIVANNWTDLGAPREDKTVYCAEDERVAGSTSRQYTVSNAHLRVPALGDHMKQADPRSRVVVVGGKDRSAVMMGGRNPDQRWWWMNDRFTQNSSAAPAPVAEQVNAVVARALAAPRLALTPNAYCAAKDRPIPIGKGITVGTHRFQRDAADAKGFTNSPELDGATLAMAAALTQHMQLGKGPASDLLAVSLAATDYVGHRYGTNGVEMCLQLMSLDADLRSFLAVLDRTGVDYAVVLTADHGGLDLPERQRLQGVPGAARVDPAILPGELGKQVAARLGIAAPVFVGDYYLAASVPAARRSEVLALARDVLARHAQVHSVFTKAEVAAAPLPQGRPEGWSVLERFRASFDPARSGDLFVALKPNIMPIPDPTNGYVATHGSVWDYDRKVPILFWWNGVQPQERTESAMTVDIMPTLAALLGLGTGAAPIDGRCLELRRGAEAACR